MILEADQYLDVAALTIKVRTINNAYGCKEIDLGEFHSQLMAAGPMTLEQMWLDPHPLKQAPPKRERYIRQAQLSADLWKPVLDTPSNSILQNGNLDGKVAVPTLRPPTLTGSVFLVVSQIRNALVDIFEEYKRTSYPPFPEDLSGIEPLIAGILAEVYRTSFEHSHTKHDLENNLGGFNEGLSIVGMAMAAAIEPDNQVYSPPQQIREVVNQAAALIIGLTHFNIIPQKVLDTLVASRINPFIKVSDPERLAARADVFNFIQFAGERILTNPSFCDKSFLDPSVFHSLVNLVPSGWWIKTPDIDQLTAVYYNLFQSNSLQGPTKRPTPLDPFKISYQIKIRMEGSELPILRTSKQRQEFRRIARIILGIMEAFTSTRTETEQTKTIGCPAMHARVIYPWYRFIGGRLCDWYEEEYSKIAK